MNMTLLDDISASNAWDTRYLLPLCPQDNNPWIYGAYALKLLRLNGLNASDGWLLEEHFDRFADGCRRGVGVFKRWPDGSGNFFSQDEMMGMAYISKSLALELYTYLEKTNGVYINNAADAALLDADVRFDVYRFIWMRPFLQASAGITPSIWSQILFCINLFDDIRLTKQGDFSDAGGRLRIWIMFDAMKKFPLTNLMISIWAWRMNSIGFTLKNCFAVEPKSYPVFVELAKGGF